MQSNRLRIPYSWENRRPEIHEGVLFIPNYYDRHREWIFPCWEEIFGNSNPVTIEYCAGNGAWITEKAKDSSRNWIAVEWRLDRIQKIWSKKKNSQLNNLFIVYGDARIFIQDYLRDESVCDVYVNFPDPWPKSKHAKNRLFQPFFISHMTRTVQVGGLLTVVTDDPPYSQQILQTVFSHFAWQSVYEPPYYITEWKNYGHSFFSALWREKGREIRYFQFVKT